MKTIALDQGDDRIAEALKRQSREEPILLTQGPDALGLLLRLPEGTNGSGVDAILRVDEPTGQIVIVVETKSGAAESRATPASAPVFGSCKGALTMVSEDETHLEDFEEYME